LKSNRNLLSPKAIELIDRKDFAKQKFLVTGASGWLGKTFFALHKDKGHEFLFLGSRARDVVSENHTLRIHEYDKELIEDYSPTVIVDFGFLTHEHLRTMPEDEYRKVNERLIEQATDVLQMSSVRYGLFTSSGFAVFPTDATKGDFSSNPYGYLKRLTEDRVLEISQKTGKASVIMRPWSLSGTLATKSHSAFASFIKQSFSNVIEVEATNQVHRRYSSAEDFLALATVRLFSGNCHGELFDSGGDLVSLIDLAKKIAQSQDHDVRVVTNILDTKIDDYHSDDSQWAEACRKFDFVPETIDEQIYRNLAFARNSQ
jgi:nucleoside-diphosphate-sugar epimerase